VQSQVSLHAPYGGVIPELASRDHLRNVGPVVREALTSAKLGWDAIDGIAVTNRPGLVGALLVGVQAAKGLAWARGLPLVGVDHLVGHLLAVFLRRDADGNARAADDPAPAFPFVALLASGGPTAIYRVDGPSAREPSTRSRRCSASVTPVAPRSIGWRVAATRRPFRSRSRWGTRSRSS
jgi:N6-L-threonylcarbamoyladenine synthase